jgi:hypothetical protein
MAGVDGLCSEDDDDSEDAEGGVVSRDGVVLLSFGGESGSEGGRAGFVGSEARGDGGGRTNEVGRSELGGANDFMDENDGAGIGGIYSVS